MQDQESLLIAIPRSRADGRESLSQLFRTHSRVRVNLDDERRRGDRRRSAEAAAELAARLEPGVRSCITTSRSES
jgi:hypothetical protein